MRHFDLSAALEAIDFQRNDPLHSLLTPLFDRLIAQTEVDQIQRVVGEIQALVRRHTKMNFILTVVEDEQPRASAVVIPLSRDSALYTNADRFHARKTEFPKVAWKDALGGTVDLATGQVSGLFSELQSQVNIHRPLLRAPFTGADVAAFTLHEIGHHLSSYLLLGRLASTNFILADIAETFSKTRDPQVRLAILNDVEDHAQHKFEDIEGLARTDDPTTALTVVQIALMERVRRELGFSHYQERMDEALADQYVARQGGAKALVMGLDKLNRTFGNDGEYAWQYKSTASIMATNMLSFLFSLIRVTPLLRGTQLVGIAVGTNTLSNTLATIEIGAVWRTVMLFIRGKSYLYDDPRNRYDAIRREVIASLKDPQLSRADQRQALDDLEVIEQYINQLQKIPELTRYLGNLYHDYLNGSFKEAKFQRQYEELAHNRLFAAAARLNTLS